LSISSVFASPDAKTLTGIVFWIPAKVHPDKIGTGMTVEVFVVFKIINY
jgi:hypothetical protein